MFVALSYCSHLPWVLRCLWERGLLSDSATSPSYYQDFLLRSTSFLRFSHNTAYFEIVLQQFSQWRDWRYVHISKMYLMCSKAVLYASSSQGSGWMATAVLLHLGSCRVLFTGASTQHPPPALHFLSFPLLWYDASGRNISLFAHSLNRKVHILVPPCPQRLYHFTTVIPSWLPFSSLC